MMKKTIARALLAGAGACLAPLVFTAGPAAAMPVFDSANYAQNLLIAARTLQQINRQVESLQNEAEMLRRMGRNLERIDFPQLERLNGTLRRIDRLMEEARGLDFRVADLDRRMDAMFPGGVDAAARADRRIGEARVRLETAMAGFRHGMSVQAQVVENVREDMAILGEIVARSQGAEGSLQAQQATNQLLALTAKQQLQLQNLMAAEFRSQTLERARRVQAEVEARESTRRFLGSGRASNVR
ncbi:MAG: P-type conjugative transfer protein TrbJ [Allosphingosinicella sp.]|uniref:P-type conjugative transfer protein TrbJ n=1 Tax=Allosphingosinicella sp. TaxID=2823234 RepID=UPI00394E40D3